jgi:tRNA-dihydrouridine synthase A
LNLAVINPQTTNILLNKQGARRFSVAPMMEWTDRHYRYFARLISQHTLLYSEMVTSGALIHGDKHRHLQYNVEEEPVALQLGGSNAKELALCCKMAEDYGYNEVNLNVGCPSDRVQNNMIGACLMGHASLVNECLSEMSAATSLPVTIKHRIGIDDLDSPEFLFGFVDEVKKSGCATFIVHARKAILQGLSPKENRHIPPLIYDRVYNLKSQFPELEVIINGGIKTLDEIQTHLQHVDGVMVGREAYQNPWLLSDIDKEVFKDTNSVSQTRHDIVRLMLPYMEDQLNKGQRLNYMTRHILGIFHGQAGGKRFRRFISENAHKPGADVRVVEAALELVPETP